MKHLLYLDDLQIGQQFISAKHRLDIEQVKTFAKQFDPQPFHLDEKKAKNTLFGELVASGWHTAAITMRLLVESIGHRFVGGFIGTGAEISWPCPTRVNDILHAECEILAIKPSMSRPDWGRVKIRSHTLNQQQQIVQILVADIMVSRKNDS